MLKKCNKCGFQQNEFLNINGRNYCKSCNSEISNNNTSTLDSITLSAYDKKAIYNIFRLTIKGTERYIEASGCYSDWENRKQIRDDNTVRFSDPKEAEESLVVALFGFKSALKDAPPFLQEELKLEFCSWINATGINISNCHSERLKHILFEINEIIKGEGGRLAKESASWAHEGVKKMSDEEFSKKMNEGFIGIQAPLNSEREVAKSLIGKTYKDVESKKMFNGNSEKGEQSLNLIVEAISSKHKDFHFFPQKDQQLTDIDLVDGSEMDIDWIGGNKSQQNFSYQSNEKKNGVDVSQRDNKGTETGKILGILGIITTFAIAGIVITKKHLTKKVKKVQR